jgi:hypothetical protein
MRKQVTDMNDSTLNFPELSTPPVPMADWLEALGSKFEVAYPFLAIKFKWEIPSADGDLDKILDWVSEAADLGAERWFYRYFREPRPFSVGESAFSLLQIYVGEDLMLSLEYQIVTRVGENKFMAKNFWRDYPREDLPFVKGLFRYAAKHQAMPPCALTWQALEAPMVGM